MTAAPSHLRFTFSLSLFFFLTSSNVGAMAATDSTAPVSSQSDGSLNAARQETLFDAIDLDGDALKDVREAVASKDYPAAIHAWGQYLRHRSGIAWTFDDPHPVEKQAPGSAYKNRVADDAASGTLAGGLVKIPYTWPDNNIDWFRNQTQFVPPFNNEWQWQLCRMSFWKDLGAAYRATGDERYALAWARQLRSFVAECPVPNHLANNVGSAWRSIEAGIRMQASWPDAFFSFLQSPSVSDDDLAAYTLSSLDHGRYLRAFPTSGNFLTMEMNGLYTVGCIFPEFKQAGDWRSFAVKKLYEQEAIQFLPDGAQYELSTGYHNVALDNLSGLAFTAQRMGRMNELPAGYITGMENAYAFNLYLMAPDRSLPKFNDSWPVAVPGVMKQALKFFPDRDDFQWAATDGKEGRPPSSTSHAFLWAGFFAMRSSWEKDANYAAFRAGPIGYGHCHQDKLDLLIWADGTQVLYSSGGGSYEKSKWRDYSTDTFSHNCVLVDGKPQRRQTENRDANIAKAPVDARWQSTREYDFAAGVYDDGYGDETSRIATQTRRVLFVKPDLFIVADTLVPNDTASHSYEARWHLLPPQTRQNPECKEVTTTAPDQPNLAVIPLSVNGLGMRDVSAQTQPELLGWNVRKDMNPESIPATTVVHSKIGAGAQQFLTLFIPIKAGEPEPVKSVESKGETSAVVTLTDGRSLTISADANPSGAIKLVERLANGAAGRSVESR